MSNYENLMINYGRENFRVIFVEYEKMPIGHFIMSKSVEKGFFSAFKCVGHTFSPLAHQYLWNEEINQSPLSLQMMSYI